MPRGLGLTLGFFPHQKPRPKIIPRFFYWSMRVAAFGSLRRWAFRVPPPIRRIVTYWHIVYMRFYRA